MSFPSPPPASSSPFLFSPGGPNSTPISPKVPDASKAKEKGYNSASRVFSPKIFKTEGWKKSKWQAKSFFRSAWNISLKYLLVALALEPLVVIVMLLHRYEILSEAPLDSTMFTTLGVGLTFLIGIKGRYSLERYSSATRRFNMTQQTIIHISSIISTYFVRLFKNPAYNAQPPPGQPLQKQFLSTAHHKKAEVLHWYIKQTDHEGGETAQLFEKRLQQSQTSLANMSSFPMLSPILEEQFRDIESPPSHPPLYADPNDSTRSLDRISSQPSASLSHCPPNTTSHPSIHHAASDLSPHSNLTCSEETNDASSQKLSKAHSQTHIQNHSHDRHHHHHHHHEDHHQHNFFDFDLSHLQGSKFLRLDHLLGRDENTGSVTEKHFESFSIEMKRVNKTAMEILAEIHLILRNLPEVIHSHFSSEELSTDDLNQHAFETMTPCLIAEMNVLCSEGSNPVDTMHTMLMRRLMVLQEKDCMPAFTPQVLTRTLNSLNEHTGWLSGVRRNSIPNLYRYPLFILLVLYVGLLAFLLWPIYSWLTFLLYPPIACCFWGTWVASETIRGIMFSASEVLYIGTHSLSWVDETRETVDANFKYLYYDIQSIDASPVHIIH